MKNIFRFLITSMLVVLFSMQANAQIESLSDAAKLSKAELLKLRKELALKNSHQVLTKDAAPKSTTSDVTYFADKNLFITATAGYALNAEDFHQADSRLGHGGFWWTGILDKNTNNFAFHSGEIVDGITIRPSYDWLTSPLNESGEYDNDNFSAIGLGVYDLDNAHTVVSPSYFVDKTVLEFSPAVNAVAFDIYPYWSENNDVVTLYDSNGSVIATNENAPSRFDGGFFGVVSSTAIAKITVHDPLGNAYGDCEFVGNVQFGSSSQNPPPFLANMEESLLFYGNKFALKTVTTTTTVSGPATCSSATIKIASNYVMGKDVIMLNPGTGLMNKFDIRTGTLTISGIAPTSVYQNALRNILYIYGNPQIPITTPNKQVSFTVYNGSKVSNTVTRTITFNIVPTKETANSIDIAADQKPTEFSLYQNYPNPFNPVTNIRFAIPQDGFVSLKVYNLLGEEVASLMNNYVTAGTYQVPFDGNKLSSGTYFYRLTSGNFVETKKFMLMK